MRVTPNVAGARHDRQVEIDRDYLLTSRGEWQDKADAARVERDAALAEVERVTALAERLAEALELADEGLRIGGFQDIQPVRATVRAALAAWKERHRGQGELPEASQRRGERQGT